MTDADEDAELRKLVAARLAQIAREGNDPALAQRLLVKVPGLLGDESERVAQLASGASRARVEARTVGLLLDLRDDASRRRGAEIVQGVAFGLGLPGSAARLVSRDTRAAGSTGSTGNVGNAGNTGAAKRVEDALAALSADGASVIIAGADEQSAEIAATFADAHHVPLLLLEPPTRQHPEGFSFVVGAGAASVEAALVGALVARGASAIAVVTDAAEQPRGPRPEITLVRGCSDVSAPATGVTGAPGAAGGGSWRAAGVQGLALMANAECAREALLGVPPSLRVAAGFEAEGLSLPLGSLVATAGLLPLAPGSPALQDWLKGHPSPPGYWSALARDAAVLAWAAVQGLPAQGTEDPAEVSARRAQATATLASATVTLWTTEASGFRGARTLPRTLGVREVARPAR
jgi:hypothetical protein